MRERIIFLDIDGVVAPGKIYVLEENNELLQNFNKKLIQRKEFALGLTFDRIAISLINRLCEKSKAKLVIVSNWRRNIGADETKVKLIEQGIKESHFHNDFYCPHKLTSDKSQDIIFWLDEHRGSKKPIKDRLDLNVSFEERAAANRKFAEEYHNFEVDYLVIDDENITDYCMQHEYQVRPNYYEGFSVDNYRVSLGFFNEEDLMFGVYALSNNDLKMIKSAERFEHAQYIEIISWLYSLDDNNGYTEPRVSDLSYKSCWLRNKSSTNFAAFGFPSMKTRDWYNQRRAFFIKDLNGEIK